jgi:hypothetical protein
MLQFLIIILIGGVIGYFLGRSKYGDSIKDTYDRSRTTVSNSWQKRFGQSKNQGDEPPEMDEPTETDDPTESEGE